MGIDDNLNKTIEELPKGDRKELDFLYKELDSIEDDKEDIIAINNKKLKKRVAKFFLKLVSTTGDDEESIQKTAYIIIGFVQYKFNDSLDKIISIAAELELPKNYVSGNAPEMFKNMEKLLKKYLS